MTARYAARSASTPASGRGRARLLHLAAASLLAMVLTGSTGDRVRASLPGGLAGCYALYDRRGLPASDSLYFAPTQVRLETTGHALRRPAKLPTWSLVRLDSAGRPAAEREYYLEYLYWGRTESPDSVQVRFSNGLSGTDMKFAIPVTRPDTLHGRARVFFDVIPPGDTEEGSVTAVRIPCVAAKQPA